MSSRGASPTASSALVKLVTLDDHLL